jgi:hypothetical protein
VTTPTPAEVRVLHAVRVLGYADTERLARRAAASPDAALQHLGEAQRRGWVVPSSFAGDEGWSLTESGKAHDEDVMAIELDETGARGAVEGVYRDFLPLNEVVAGALTAWQLTEMGIGAQRTTLADTIATLETAATALAEIERLLTSHLMRFSGYHDSFRTALTRARTAPAWIVGTDRDSCHRVWFELHEDLIATLGLTR